MFLYDQELVRLLAQTAPVTTSEVTRRFDELDRVLTTNDGLKWFHWLYVRVAEAVQAALASGGWHNAGLLKALNFESVKLYFQAVRSFLSGENCPACWRVMLSKRGEVGTTRIQFAIAGINAHVNHDLPQVLVSTWSAAGISPFHGGPEYLDFTALNSAIDSIVTPATDFLKVRLSGEPVPDLTQLEAQLAAWSISAAREAAWTNAEVLSTIRTLGGVQTRFLDMLDGFASLANKTLMTPPPG